MERGLLAPDRSKKSDEGIDERVHSSVPGDEEGYEDENACEERQPKGGLVDHVANRRAASGSSLSVTLMLRQCAY